MRLVVTRNGIQILELDLIEGNEYFGGRSSDNDIVLPKQTGISRKHIRIFYDNGTWNIELLSKYGALIVNDESAESAEVTNESIVQIPPFSFNFSEETVPQEMASHENLTETQEPTNEDITHEEEASEKNEIAILSHQPIELEDLDSNTTSNDLDGRTVVRTLNYVAYVKVSQKGGLEEIVRLDGERWVAGRDQNCDIVLNNSYISRNHFEIFKDMDKYFIRDKGSVNETLLNDHVLPPGEDTELQSGDAIEVQDITVVFEIRDENFQKYLVGVNPAAQAPIEFGNNLPAVGMEPNITPHLGIPLPPPPQSGGGGRGVEVVRGSGNGKFDFQKHKIRIIIGLLIPVILYGLVSEDGSPKKPTPSGDQETTGTSLSPDEQTAIKDSYKLASRYFRDRRYSLCIDQIKKVHDKVSFYESSKEIEKNCINALELEKITRHKEKLREEERKNKAFIAEVAQKCEEKLETYTTMEQLDECLAPAIEIDPLNEKIVALKDIIQQREIQRQLAAENEQKRKALVQKNNSLYRNAKKEYDSKNWKKAISAYEKYLSTNYPDPSGHKNAAKRELASASKNFEVALSENLNACKTDFGNEAFKAAILNCDKVLKISPKHAEAGEYRSWAETALNKQLKRHYEDAILEASFGNSAKAIEKWKKIKEEDVEGGFYYKKATSQLKKLGGG